MLGWLKSPGATGILVRRIHGNPSPSKIQVALKHRGSWTIDIPICILNFKRIIIEQLQKPKGGVSWDVPFQGILLEVPSVFLLQTAVSFTYHARAPTEKPTLRCFSRIRGAERRATSDSLGLLRGRIVKLDLV